jgi:hypothetical protein
VLHWKLKTSKQIIEHKNSMYHCSISHGCWTGVHSHNSPCLNHRAATKWNNWVNQEYNSNICIAVQKLSTPMSDYYSINLDKITYSRQILPCKSFLGDVRCTRFINHLMNFNKWLSIFFFSYQFHLSKFYRA